MKVQIGELSDSFYEQIHPNLKHWRRMRFIRLRRLERLAILHKELWDNIYEQKRK